MNRLDDALNTPWKMRNEVFRLLTYPWVRLFFATHGIAWGQGWKIYGTPIIMRHRQSDISLGSGLNLRSSRYSNPLSPNHPVVLCTWRAGACLTIGSDFAITGGGLVAAVSITVGDRVNIGANSIVTDTDFHPLHPARRQVEPAIGACAPVIIEDDVFVGMDCLILKGVTIGRGSVIGAGAVVAASVPPYSIAVGNPARVIRQLEPMG